VYLFLEKKNGGVTSQELCIKNTSCLACLSTKDEHQNQPNRAKRTTNKTTPDIKPFIIRFAEPNVGVRPQGQEKDSSIGGEANNIIYPT
jgi:hypothetical protein